MTKQSEAFQKAYPRFSRKPLSINDQLECEFKFAEFCVAFNAGTKQAAEDAELFRFLTEQDIENDFPRSGIFIGKIPDNCALTGNEARAAIRAAMAKADQS